MEVLLKIVGKQLVDGHIETGELVTEGTMQCTPDGICLCYTETEATGMAGTETALYVQPHKVTIKRRGTHAALLVLEQQKRHLCNYGTPYGDLMLGVYTETVKQDLTPDGGTLHVRYTLDVGGGVASRQDLHITVKQKNVTRKEEKDV